MVNMQGSALCPGSIPGTLITGVLPDATKNQFHVRYEYSGMFRMRHVIQSDSAKCWVFLYGGIHGRDLERYKRVRRVIPD